MATTSSSTRLLGRPGGSDNITLNIGGGGLGSGRSYKPSRGKSSKSTTKVTKYMSDRGVEPWMVGLGVGALVLAGFAIWSATAGAAQPGGPGGQGGQGGQGGVPGQGGGVPGQGGGVPGGGGGELPPPPAGARRAGIRPPPPNARFPGLKVRSSPNTVPGEDPGTGANQTGGVAWNSLINVLSEAPGGWLQIQGINNRGDLGTPVGAVIQGYVCNTCTEAGDEAPYVR